MSVYKHTTPNGKVRYRVTTWNKHLKRNVWVGSFDLKKDARRAELEARRRIQMGEPLKEHRDIGFAELRDAWLASLTRRESTIQSYRYETKALELHFKNRPVSSLVRQDVLAFIAWASNDAGYSPSYVRKLKTRLSQILAYGLDCGYGSSNAAAGRISNLPSAPGSGAVALEPDEVRRLIEAAPAYWRPFFLMAVACGLRRGELAGLTWNEVSFETSTVTVRYQLTGRTLRAELKTASAARTVPMPEAVVTAMRSHRLACPPNDLNLVFPMPESGSPIDFSNFYKRILRPTARRAGLPDDFKLKDLRSTFSSAIIAQGRSPAYWMEVMGHSSPQVALRYYARVLDSEKEAAAQDMEDWLAEEDRMHTAYLAAY